MSSWVKVKPRGEVNTGIATSRTVYESKNCESNSSIKSTYSLRKGSFRDPEAYTRIASLIQKEGLNEQDIWNADPRILKVYEMAKDEMKRIYEGDDNFITIAFHETTEFGTREPKTYKIDKDKPVYYFIGLICKSLNVDFSRTFSLRTEGGNILNDELPLSAYGYGTLLKEWKLLIIRKSPNLIQTKGQGYPVAFLFPQIEIFKNQNKRTQIIQTTTPVGQLLDLFGKRYDIKNLDDFVLTTEDGYEFSRKESLGYYGLGSKFPMMTVKIFQKRNSAKPLNISQEFAWTIVAETLNSKETRSIFLRLDNILNNTKENIASLRSEKSSLSNTLGILKKEKQELEEAHEKLRHQAKQLIDVYNKTKEQEAGLIQQKSTMLKNKTLLAEKLEEAINVIKQLKMGVEEKDARIQSQRLTYEKEISTLEQTYTVLESDLREETSKNLQLIEKTITIESEISELNLQIDRNKIEVSHLQESLVSLNRKENELSSELSAINKNILFLTHNEEQSLTSIANLEKSKVELLKSLEVVSKEKQSLGDEIYRIKDTLEIELGQKSEKVLVLEKTVQSLESEKDTIVKTYESQMVNLKKSLETTESSQSGLQTENSKLREQLTTLTKEIENTKAVDTDTSKISNLTKEHDNLKKQLEALQKESNKVSNDLSNITKTFAKENKDNEYLRSKLEDLESRIVKEKESGSIKSQNAVLEKQCQELTQNIALQEQSLREINETNLQLKAQQTNLSREQDKDIFNDLNNKIIKLTDDRSSLEKGLLELKEKVSQLRETNAEQKKQIAQIPKYVAPTPPPLPTKEVKYDRNKVSLENQIHSIRETLQNSNTKKRDTPVEGSVAAVLIQGLRHKFKNVLAEERKDYEDLDELDDDTFYVSNDLEEEWD